MSMQVGAIPARSSSMRAASGQFAHAFSALPVARRARLSPTPLHASITSCPTSYWSLPAQGPIAAIIDSVRAPKRSHMSRTVAPTTSTAMPRQPAWIAAQERECVQTTSKGTQSAVETIGTSSGSFETTASASGSSPSTQAPATTHCPPCTCRARAGRANSPARCCAIH